MTYQTILYDIDDRVATITWNRPEKLNSMTPELKAEFCDALLRSEADDSVKVVVFRGAGRAFSAGAELHATSPRTWPSGIPEGMEAGEFVMRAYNGIGGMYRYADIMFTMRKPVIAQVHSWCMGEASFAAVMADITIASDDAMFGAPEIREAQPAMTAWMFATGWKNAMRYNLTGDHLDAKEALRIGLVNEVVPREELDTRVTALARRLLHIPTDALYLNKQMIRQTMEVLGVRSAFTVQRALGALLLGAPREEPLRRLEEAGAERGLRGFLEVRDGPFQPEPFGPRSRR